MRIRVAAVLSSLAAIACSGESVPTGPDVSLAPQFAQAQAAPAKSMLAEVRKLQLSSRTMVLDGTPVPYVVKLFNPTNQTMSEVWYQVMIEQGANNELPGDGTLVPGPANLVLRLSRGFEAPVLQDVVTMRVVLVAP